MTTYTTTTRTTYTVIDQSGDFQLVATFVSADGVERIIGTQTSYTGTHGRNASIGAAWDYSVIGEDEDDYGGSTAQVWVSSLEGEGDAFDPCHYKHVSNGYLSPFSEHLDYIFR